jgi:hypothetical protein
MNHFLYLQEIPIYFIADGDKQHAYKGKGGIDMCCHPPFVLKESWESLVKHISSSSENSNQASTALPTEESTSEESSQEPLIASTIINNISTVPACAWHQANIKNEFVCSIKGTNPIQCRYGDTNCSCLVHRECAIACCESVGLVYTVENGKNAMCPDHHPGFK